MIQGGFCKLAKWIDVTNSSVYYGSVCAPVQVLKISLIGHRKRILASLGDRLHEDTPQKPPRAISLRVSVSRVPPEAFRPSRPPARRFRPHPTACRLCAQEPGGLHTPPQLSPAAYAAAGVPGGSLDVQHLIMQADARRRVLSSAK